MSSRVVHFYFPTSGTLFIPIDTERLGVSRKTFYKWEQRGLSGLLDSVTDQPPGRPAHPSDDHRQWLEKQLQDANRQIDLLNRKMALKDVLMDLKLPQTGSDRTKKK
ncbi:hypothetical protein [uncultured Desulfosarcina sp.]|uniref:hypothetical protein n=1 Tax=uncultured Desulfosarcina sp. TaxID=218289 RepID=UPI0029C70E05|nr:hypothetical protein [uncultured Desulfosarcina sp.]